MSPTVEIGESDHRAVAPCFAALTECGKSKTFREPRKAFPPMRRAVVKSPVFMCDQRDTSIEAVGVGPS